VRYYWFLHDDPAVSIPECDSDWLRFHWVFNVWCALCCLICLDSWTRNKTDSQSQCVLYCIVVSYVQHFSAWLMSRHRARIKFVWPEHLSVTLPRHWYNTWNIPLLTIPGHSLTFVGIHADWCSTRLCFEPACFVTVTVRDIMWRYAAVAFVCCCSYLLEPGLNTFTVKIFCSNYQSLKNRPLIYNCPIFRLVIPGENVTAVPSHRL
jgi:hypothetical protein